MPKGLRILHLSLRERNLTHFGGIFPIHQFCKKLRIKWYLQKRYHSDRILSPLGKIGQDATPECSQITERVYLQIDLGSYHPEYQKNEIIINFN